MQRYGTTKSHVRLQSMNAFNKRGEHDIEKIGAVRLDPITICQEGAKTADCRTSNPKILLVFADTNRETIVFCSPKKGKRPSEVLSLLLINSGKRVAMSREDLSESRESLKVACRWAVVIWQISDKGIENSRKRRTANKL